MRIEELRAQARVLRESIYDMQDAHPRQGMLKEMVAAANGLDYNLHLIQVLVNDGRGHDDAIHDLFTRTGYCLGKLRTMAWMAERWTSREMRQHRPLATRWVCDAAELVNLLQVVDLERSVEVAR